MKKIKNQYFSAPKNYYLKRKIYFRYLIQEKDLADLLPIDI